VTAPVAILVGPPGSGKSTVGRLVADRLNTGFRDTDDEVAAAAMGVNTVRIKLLAFAIGAAFSGFAGAYYGAKLSLVSPENFGFSVSITILVMIVLGGMGNIPGVIVGSLLIYYVSFITFGLFLTAKSVDSERWRG